MTSKVDFYSDDFKTPSALTDIDHSWSSDTHKDLIATLQDKFGDGMAENGIDTNFKAGDPRLLTADASIELMIAVHNGRVGVLSTAMLMACASDDLIDYVRQDMAKLQIKYPKSEIFLVTRTNIFTGRVMIVSFTPLDEDSEMNYSSPYADPKTIRQLQREISGCAAVPF